MGLNVGDRVITLLLFGEWIDKYWLLLGQELFDNMLTIKSVSNEALHNANVSEKRLTRAIVPRISAQKTSKTTVNHSDRKRLFLGVIWWANRSQ